MRVGKRDGARRFARVLGTLLIVAGVGLLAWTAVVWQWEDPFTALYTKYEQHKLASHYTKVVAAYRPQRLGPSVEDERALVAREARLYRATLHAGDPVGLLVVPRLGLKIVLVAGTDHESLKKGPGWYSRSFLPGEGQLIYIAGHRTTYLAPFAHIDSLRPGDEVTIEVPYGTFLYRVRSHVIVRADDLARLRSHGHEVVALQACHPRFFATHRYIVYAVPVRVSPRGGRPYPVG